MKTSALFRKLQALVVIGAVVATASPAFSQGKGKGKAKANQKIEAKENHGREKGGLPYGLEQLSEKKGLPSGLEKKNEDGYLTHGLEGGGKKLTSGGKGKKGGK